MLLSDTGREDVHAFWWAALRLFWQGCPYPVALMDKTTKFCWSKRLLNQLYRTKEEWVLLWVDDSILQRSVLVKDFERCLDFFLAHGDIGLFHVGRCHSKRVEKLVPIQSLSPFAYYPQTLGGLTRAMIPHPTLWRKEALIQVTESSVLLTTPEQDDGWAGFYNWELGGGHVLLEEGWRAVVMLGDWNADKPPVPIRICNAVRQGLGWTGHALDLAAKIGFALNPALGYAPHANVCPTPGSDAWRAAGHVRR